MISVLGQDGFIFDQQNRTASFEFLDGRNETITVAAYPCSRLVTGLVLCLGQKANRYGEVQSPGSVRHYRRVIRTFSTFMSERGFSGSVEDIAISDLYDYGGSVAHHLERGLRNLLRASLALSSPHRVSVELTPHLQSPLVAVLVDSTPLAPYSRSEAERIKTACRRDIEEFRRNRERVLEIARSGDSLEAEMARLALQTPNPPDLRRGANGKHKLRTFRDAARYLYPSALDALPFRILVGLATGIPAESLNTLRCEDILITGPKEAKISYVKNRAAGREARSISRKGPWNPLSLLKEWMDLTEAARRATSPGVWAYWHPTSREPLQASWSGNWKIRDKWLARHGLLDDGGKPLSLDLRRLRTTWNASVERRWNGSIATDPNRSTAVEGDHYLQRPRNQDAIDLEIIQTFQEIALKALNRDIGLVADADLADLVEAVGDPGDSDLPSGPMDMFAALCRDPYGSPFSPKDSFCSAAVWNCLVCPNAIFSERHLDNLVRLEGFLRGKSNDVTLEQWVHTFGAAWAVLVDRLLPQFPSSLVADSRARVAAGTEIPFLALEVNL